MCVEEVEQQVAAFAAVFGIHRHLAEEVFYLRILHCEGAESVPKVVQGVDGFRLGAGGLVVGCHERAAEFQRLGKVVVEELTGETEHVCRGDARGAIRLAVHLLAEQEAVTSDDFAVHGIPHYELAAGTLHGVEVVDVAGFAGAPSAVAEGQLAQTPYLAHGLRLMVRVDDIYPVSAFVRLPEQALLGEFADYFLSVYLVYYLLHRL
jgi:hypothetical protein